MFLNKSFPYSSSNLLHSIIASINGGILVFILIFLQPFEMVDFSHPFKNLLLFGYGVCAFIGYIVFHFLERLYYKKHKNWNWGNEITFLVGSSLLGILLGYSHHISFVVPSNFSVVSLLYFIFYICLPILPLIAMPTLVARYLMIKESAHSEEEDIISSEEIEYITIPASTGKEVFTVKKDKLIYVSALDNYVQLYYLDKENQVRKIIIRNTLSNIEKVATSFLKTHRSYIVNPSFVKKIQGNSQKAFVELNNNKETIPLSKSYYKKVKESVSFNHKK